MLRDSPGARVTAAIALLDRAYGKAPERSWPHCPAAGEHHVLDCADAAQVGREKTGGRQIFTRFRLNCSAGRACATDAQAITTEVGGHVESSLLPELLFSFFLSRPTADAVLGLRPSRRAS